MKKTTFPLVKTWITLRWMWCNNLEEFVIPNKNYKNKQRFNFKTPTFSFIASEMSSLSSNRRRQTFHMQNLTQNSSESHFSPSTENERKTVFFFFSKKNMITSSKFAMEVGSTITNETSELAYHRFVYVAPKSNFMVQNQIKSKTQTKTNAHHLDIEWSRLRV